MGQCLDHVLVIFMMCEGDKVTWTCCHKGPCTTKGGHTWQFMIRSLVSILMRATGLEISKIGMLIEWKRMLLY